MLLWVTGTVCVVTPEALIIKNKPICFAFNSAFAIFANAIANV